MYAMLVLLLAIVTFIFVYVFLTLVLKIPSDKSRKALLKIRKSSATKSLTQGLLEPAIKKISKFIKISEYKKSKLAIGLKKIGVNISPEEYMSQAIIKALLIAMLALIFILINIPIPAIGCVLLAIMTYFNEMRKIDIKLKETSDKILKELPRFIRTFSNSLNSTNDIIKIFETYRKVAGKAFQYDLDVLITDLKIGNHEEALRKFDERLNIPQLSTFISGVIGTSKGIDQNTFFVFMEENMKALARENLRRELQKRPGKFNKATWAVAGCGLLMYIVPVASSLIEGLEVLK